MSSPATQLSNSQRIPKKSPKQRADLAVQNIISKVAQLIVQSRHSCSGPSTFSSTTLRRTESSGRKETRVPGNATFVNENVTASSSSSLMKIDNSFFIETEENESVREELRFWRREITESSSQNFPPVIIEIFIDCTSIPLSHGLMFTDENGRESSVRGFGGHPNQLGIISVKRSILLESWKLSLASAMTPNSLDSTQLSSIFKKALIFFRVLYGYLRLLPAYALAKKIKTRISDIDELSGLRVNYRITTDTSRRPDEIPLDSPVIDGETQPFLSDYTFEPFDTHLGQLKLSLVYRRNCNFWVKALGRSPYVASSAASRTSINMDMDEVFFTPSLAKDLRMRQLLAKSADGKVDSFLSTSEKSFKPNNNIRPQSEIMFPDTFNPASSSSTTPIAINASSFNTNRRVISSQVTRDAIDMNHSKTYEERIIDANDEEVDLITRYMNEGNWKQTYDKSMRKSPSLHTKTPSSQSSSVPAVSSLLSRRSAAGSPIPSMLGTSATSTGSFGRPLNELPPFAARVSPSRLSPSISTPPQEPNTRANRSYTVPSKFSNSDTKSSPTLGNFPLRPSSAGVGEHHAGTSDGVMPRSTSFVSSPLANHPNSTNSKRISGGSSVTSHRHTFSHASGHKRKSVELTIKRKSRGSSVASVDGFNSVNSSNVNLSAPKGEDAKQLSDFVRFLDSTRSSLHREEENLNGGFFNNSLAESSRLSQVESVSKEKEELSLVAQDTLDRFRRERDQHGKWLESLWSSSNNYGNSTSNNKPIESNSNGVFIEQRPASLKENRRVSFGKRRDDLVDENMFSPTLDRDLNQLSISDKHMDGAEASKTYDSRSITRSFKENW